VKEKVLQEVKNFHGNILMKIHHRGGGEKGRDWMKILKGVKNKQVKSIFLSH
jgi:hypothetical protein